MSEELKPCPFCGGEARWVEEHDRIGEPFGLVVDHGERCFIGSVMMADWDTIIAAWNTRAALKGRDVVLEEAAERAAFVAGYRAAHMVPDAYDSTSAAEEAWGGYRLVSRNLKERV